MKVVFSLNSETEIENIRPTIGHNSLNFIAWVCWFLQSYGNFFNVLGSNVVWHYTGGTYAYYPTPDVIIQLTNFSGLEKP